MHIRRCESLKTLLSQVKPFEVENGTDADKALIGRAFDLVNVDVEDPTLNIESTLSLFTTAASLIPTIPQRQVAIYHTKCVLTRIV